MDTRTKECRRQRVHEFKNGLSRGIDPVAERHKQASAVTFAEFAREYMEHAKANKRTWRTDEGKLRNDLLPLWGRLPLSAITTRDVQSLYSRVRTQNSPTYANRYLALIHRMFALAIQWGRAPDARNPADGIRKYKENAARERFLTREEIDRLLAALDARPERMTANAVKFLLFTGMCRGEAIGLRWEHVDLEREAGLENLHLHDLRHTFASIAVQNGASRYEVQKLLGHASSQMTQRYAHLADDTLRAVTDGVAREITHAPA